MLKRNVAVPFISRQSSIEETDTAHLFCLVVIFFDIYSLALILVPTSTCLGLVSTSMLSSLEKVLVLVGWCGLDYNAMKDFTKVGLCMAASSRSPHVKWKREQ